MNISTRELPVRTLREDTAIKIEGDAVQSFTMMFLQMWNITERQPEDYAKYLTEKQPRFSRKDGYIIPYGDSAVRS